MSKGQSIRNAAPGPRIVNRRLDKDRVEPVILRPGETLENFEPANPEDPVFQAMVDSRQLVLGDEDPEPDPAAEEERFRNSPRQREERMIATIAGNTPGYADALPEVDHGAERRNAEVAAGHLSQEQLAEMEEQGPAVPTGDEPSRGGRRGKHK